MKISIALNEKSIDKAINDIERYRKQLTDAIPYFLEKCAKKVIELANENLSRAQNLLLIGEKVIDEIKNSWEVKIGADNKSVKLINGSDYSTYLEFGVGYIGSLDPHPNSAKARYKYDVNHHGEDGWWFATNKYDIDIGSPYINSSYYLDDGKRMVNTPGQPALMFAFNALIDFLEGKLYIPIWNEIEKDFK